MREAIDISSRKRSYVRLVRNLCSRVRRGGENGKKIAEQPMEAEAYNNNGEPIVSTASWLGGEGALGGAIVRTVTD